ncbi:MAG: hypothetical protein AAF517_15420 [Planctomycetota bacterium]
MTMFSKERVFPSEPVFLRGDANADGTRNLSDAVAVFQFLFLAGDEPPCFKAADANDDDELNITDGVAILTHLFRGRRLPEPSTACGTDRDRLSCLEFPTCF